MRKLGPATAGALAMALASALAGQAGASMVRHPGAVSVTTVDQGAGRRGAARAASGDLRCRIVVLEKRYGSYGTAKSKMRFCYSRARKRAGYGGVNIGYVSNLTLAGVVANFRVGSQARSHYASGGGFTYGQRSAHTINNRVRVEAGSGEVGSSRTAVFRVQGLWDGGYLWAVNKDRGAVAGPP